MSVRRSVATCSSGKTLLPSRSRFSFLSEATATQPPRLTPRSIHCPGMFVGRSANRPHLLRTLSPIPTDGDDANNEQLAYTRLLQEPCRTSGSQHPGTQAGDEAPDYSRGDLSYAGALRRSRRSVRIVCPSCQISQTSLIQPPLPSRLCFDAVATRHSGPNQAALGTRRAPFVTMPNCASTFPIFPYFLLLFHPPLLYGHSARHMTLRSASQSFSSSP